MKIGLFIDTFYPMVDGVIVVVDTYARELSKTDDVTVFCPVVKKNYKYDLPYKLVQCPSLPFVATDYRIPVPAFGRKFKKLLKDSDLDVVHIHSPFTVGRVGIKYAEKHNLPIVASLHSLYDQDVLKALKRKNFLYSFVMNYIMKSFNSVDACFAVNRRTADHFINDLGLKTECGVIRNASVLKPVEDEKSAHNLVNATFSLKEDETVYLYVGRIDFIKNLKFLIEALAILKSKNASFRMLFVGDGHDLHALEKLAEEKGVSDRVIFCGRITDHELLSAIYSRAKLLLFPSLYDTNSLVQLEASGQSTPTVFIKGSTTSSTTADGVNAFWSENDPAAFAEKIIEVENNAALYKKVSEGARRDLYVHWEDSVKLAREAYIKLIEKKQKR